MAGADGPSGGQLAGDRDRAAAALAVQEAAGDGRLTMGELGDRLSAVYAARTVAELADLTADVRRGLTPVRPRATDALAGRRRGRGVLPGRPPARRARWARGAEPVLLAVSAAAGLGVAAGAGGGWAPLVVAVPWALSAWARGRRHRG